MKRKHFKIKAKWILPFAIVIAAIIGGLFMLFDKQVNNEKSINSSINAYDSSSVIVTNNQNDIKGDFVSGDKIVLNHKIEAPEALIVTQNQSGGENIVNINQLTSQSYKKISGGLKDILNGNFDSLKLKYNEHLIIIEIESGNTMRDKIARDLESFLSPRDFGYYLDGVIKIGQFPDYPVKLLTNRNNLDFTMDFLKSIKPYINSVFYIDTSYSEYSGV